MQFHLIRICLIVLLQVSLLSTASAKSSCKDLSKTQCGNSSSCSWTQGYTTKKGVKVSSYCRSKPGVKKSKKKQSAKPDKKKSSSKQSKK